MLRAFQLMSPNTFHDAENVQTIKALAIVKSMPVTVSKSTYAASVS